MNRMGGDELRDFEVRISLDPELKKEVEFERLLNETIRYYRRQQLKRYLYENATSKLMGNVWGRSWTRISAVIIILMGLLVLWLKNIEQKEEQDGQIYELHPQQEAPPAAIPDTSDELNRRDDIPPSGEEHNDAVDDEPETNTTPVKELENLNVKSGWSNEASHSFTGDSIKVDFKIMDTLVNVFVAAPPESPDSALSAGSVTSGEEASALKPAGEMHVELWQSPVNYRGYRLQDAYLQLYGISGLADKRFLYRNGLLFMETDSVIYMLKESSSFNKLEARPRFQNEE